ncbi:hypothetical protein ABTN05_19985, partial [Acinetobacter baumannii]
MDIRSQFGARTQAALGVVTAVAGALVAGCSSSNSSTASSPTDPSVVQVAQGTLKGLVSDSGRQFLGIP